MSTEPLHALLNWVEEIKSTGLTVSWKDASLQNFVSLNISAHNLDKTAVVAFQVHLLRKLETVSIPVSTVTSVVSPFYQAVAMFRELGYIVVNGVSVSLVSYEGTEGIIDTNISDEAMYPSNVESKKLSGGLIFYKMLETIPVAQKTLAKAEKIKMNRSKLLGVLVNNNVAEYSLEDERCFTATIKEF